MGLDEFLARLRRECDAAGGLTAWARMNGVSPSYVCDVLMGRRFPGPKLLDAFNLEAKVTYEQKTGRNPVFLATEG